MKEISDNPSGVSYHKMDSLFNNWLGIDINARVKTLDKKQAVNFYRRWMKAYLPYVEGDGYIHLPTMKEHNAKLEAQNKRAAARLRTRAGSDKQWKNIGPFTTKRVENKPKDYQACVYRITVSPQDPKIVYCGTETGVIFKTTDKGLHWEPCNAIHNFGGAIFALQVDPNDSNTVYAGGGQNLWKTTDGGKTWKMLSDIASRVNSIRIDPKNSQYVTLSTGDSRGDSRQVSGFYVSENGGQSFRQTFSAVCHDHELQPGNGQRIYMIGKLPEELNFDFYLSEDAGKSFEKIDMPVGTIAAGRLAVSDAPTGKDYVYAMITSDFWGATNGPYGGIGTPYILKSTDAGRTWTDQTSHDSYASTFSPFMDEPTAYMSGGGQGYFDMIVGASAENPEHVIYGLCNSYRSTQGGQGVYRETAIGGYQERDGMHPDMQDIVVCGKDTWVCTDGGVKYSNNFFATRGEDRNFGIYASDYHGFGQGWNDDVMVGGRWHNGNAVMRDTYGAGNSLQVSGVEQPTGYVMLSSPNKVYFTDSGMTTIPTDINGSIEESYTQFQFKEPMESLLTSKEMGFDPRYAYRLIISSSNDQEFSKLFLTEDEGYSFKEIFDSNGEFVVAYEIARSNPDQIYVVCQNSIHYSLDGGATWNAFVSNPFNSHDLAGAAIAIDPHDATKLWYSNSYNKGHLAYTTDYGATWNYPFQNDWKMSEHKFSWIVPTGNEDHGIYVCTTGESYIFYKDDKTNGWIDYSTGFPSGARITRLTPFYKQGKLRAATNQGIWEIPLYREKFIPVAQPLALNIGNGDITETPNKEILFDSYSIVNQDGATWEWSFSPQPKQVIDADKRNPKVIFGNKGSYSVTLKVTTPQGSHSRTIPNMIRIDTPLGIETPTTPEIEATIRYVGNVPTLVLQTGQLKEKKKLTLHNANGMLLQTIEAPAEQQTIEMPLIDQKQGVYIYNLNTEHHKYFGKFLKK